MGCCDPGARLWIAFECFGRPTVDITTRENDELRKPFTKAIRLMGLQMIQINYVFYGYNILDINRTIRELGIPNGGVITIKLKESCS